MRLADFHHLYTKVRLMAIGELAVAENYEFSVMDFVLALEHELPHRSYRVWRATPSTIHIVRVG